MSDYSKHRYSYLFSYIEDEVNRLGEDKDYASLLQSMERAVSIDELIRIYNEVLIFSARTILGKTLPDNWFKITWLQANMTWLFESLNMYLNENIVRLLKTSQPPTYNQCIASLANLRECPNSFNLKTLILNGVKDQNYVEVFETVYSTMTHQCSQRRIVEKNGIRSSKEINALSMYENDSKFLAAHYRIFDALEMAFGKVHGITYEGFAEDYFKDKAKGVESRIVGELLSSGKAITNEDILNAIERARDVEMEKTVELVSPEEIIKEYNTKIEIRNQLKKQKQIEEEKRKREKRKQQLAEANDVFNDVGSTLLSAALGIPFGILGGILSSSIGKRKR